MGIALVPPRPNLAISYGVGDPEAARNLVVEPPGHVIFPT